MSPFYPFREGGGSPQGDNVTFFYRFFYSAASLSDDDSDVLQVVQLFLRRQEIPVSKVERYVLPHISSLFPHT